MIDFSSSDSYTVHPPAPLRTVTTRIHVGAGPFVYGVTRTTT
jgi:hypothetical protein